MANVAGGALTRIAGRALGDVAGAVLTVAAQLALIAGGYLLAFSLANRRGRTDSLSLAIATLLAATAQGVFVAVALGVFGLLRLDLALGAQLLLVFVLWRQLRRAGRDVLAPARALAADFGAWPRGT